MRKGRSRRLFSAAQRNSWESSYESWRSSYWLALVIAIAIGAFTIGSSLALDWMVHGVVRRIYASDLYIGLAAALFSGVALIRTQLRKRELLMRMQIVEDVNHHVRNALTAITLSTALAQDEELNTLVRDASDRIDWVLNDVLSKSVVAAGHRPTHPQWNSGRLLTQADAEQRAKSMGGPHVES
jgi:signal transduction histidine kinase